MTEPAQRAARFRLFRRPAPDTRVPVQGVFQIHLPCRCGWRVAVALITYDGVPVSDFCQSLQPGRKLDGPVKALLDHYDTCEHPTSDQGGRR